MFALCIAEWHEAGGHAMVAELAVFELADQYGTGAAVAFPATDLGADKMPMVADKIKDGCAG